MKRIGLVWLGLVGALLVAGLIWPAAAAQPSAVQDDERPTRIIDNLTPILWTPEAAGQPTPTPEEGGVGPAEDDPALDGRLGGSRASFEAVYGERASGNERRGAFYDIEGFGLVFVLFADGRVVSINLAPLRPEDLPPTEPDEADWSVEEAREIAVGFLPADISLGAEVTTPSGLAAPGQSAALAAAVSQEVYDDGEFSGAPGDGGYSAVTTTAGGVSLLTVGLGEGIAIDEGTAAERCAGIVEWAVATTARFDRASAIADELAELDPTAPGAAELLHDWNQEFLALTAEQREATVPPAAREVNQLFVGAFNAYSLTMELLTFAVATDDAAMIDQALATLDSATANIERAGALLEAIDAECGTT